MGEQVDDTLICLKAREADKPQGLTTSNAET